MTQTNSVLEPMPITKNRLRLLLFVILIQLVIFYSFIQGELTLVLAVVAGLCVLLLTVFSVERSFYLLAFYYLSFPAKTYGYNFPNWKIYFIWYIGVPLFFWLMGNWLLYLIRNQTHHESSVAKPSSTRSISFRPMDILLLIFIGAFSLSAVLGFWRGFNRTYWAYDYFGLLLYLGYFIYLYSPMSKNHRRFYDIMVLISIFVSAQYIYSLTHFGGTVVLRRVSSEHIHIAQLTLPYLGATILYASGKFRRIIFALIFPVVIFGVIICQQRSLWGSVFITMVLLLLIFAYEKRHILFRNVKKLISGVVAITIFLGVIYFLLQSLTQSKLLPTIITRIFIFLSPKMLQYDISTITRISEIQHAFSTVGNDILFGRGLGDSFITQWRHVVEVTVDNSYAFLYWKTGWVGIITFTAVMIYFLKRCISTLFKKLETEERIYVLAAFLNFVGMLIVSIINASIVHFRMIIIWAATIGLVESIARKYDKQTISNTALNEKSIK
jgi:hypothetical protein